MISKYSIVIFKNKSKIKVLKKFKKIKDAEVYFDDLRLKNEKIVFPVMVRNARQVRYEIGLIGPKKGKTEFFGKDDLGRNRKLITNEKKQTIYRLCNYKVEELIYDVLSKKRITFSEFIKTYLTFTGIKMFSKLNHKLILQEDNKLNLFSLKSQQEAERFFEILNDYIISNGRMDIMMVRDINTSHRKILYDLFKSQNLSIKMLYRRFTTHAPKIRTRCLKSES